MLVGTTEVVILSAGGSDGGGVEMGEEEDVEELERVPRVGSGRGEVGRVNLVLVRCVSLVGLRKEWLRRCEEREGLLWLYVVLAGDAKREWRPLLEFIMDIDLCN